MKYNKQQLEKFVNDPDWHIIEEIWQEIIKDFMDIESINLSENSTNVKAEIRVRKDMKAKVDKFLAEMGLIKQVLKKINEPKEEIISKRRDNGDPF